MIEKNFVFLDELYEMKFKLLLHPQKIFSVQLMDSQCCNQFGPAKGEGEDIANPPSIESAVNPTSYNAWGWNRGAHARRRRYDVGM
jgi:hypothetical protein